jgi:hypothetical protein
MHEKLLGEDYPLFVETEDDFINKIKNVLYDEEMYEKSARRAYESVKEYTFIESYKRLHLSLWSFKKDKINILFAGHDLKFINGFIDNCKSKDTYDIKIDQWSGHNKHDVEYSESCLEWADVIFCEWGLGNAVWYSNNKKPYQKLIIRMHLQERETEYPKNFNIDNIDNIIAISPYIYEEFSKKINMPREKMTMIYNYIDCDKFDLPKIEGNEYNLGIVGICPKRKRLDLAIDIFENLWLENKNYKLYVKGKKPQDYPWLWKREDEKEYYEALFNRIDNSPWKQNLIFDGHGNDMDKWFRKIGYTLSTSDFESFHLAPAEGMVSGSIPIILNWEGSNTIYKETFIFKSVEQAVNYIRKNRGNIGSSEYKDYVKSNFDNNVIYSSLEKLI